jgi:transposase
MVRSAQFSDEMWARIEPLMPRTGPKGGRPWNDHRVTVEGICWRLRTGSPWRDVPAEFGPWPSLWRRFNDWARDGTWDQVLTAIAGSGEENSLVAVVDGTIVRAHKHAAGARKGG